MSNLWDRIHHHPLPPEIPDLAGVEAIDISDVLAFHATDPRTDQDFCKLPNIAPPFHRYFMFGSMGSTFRVGDETRPLTGLGQIGALLVSKKIPTGWEVGARFVGGKIPLWQNFGAALTVKNDGSVAQDDPRGNFAVFLPKKSIPYTDQEVVDAVAGHLYPYLLATSMLHCKNIVARRIDYPAKVMRAAERRGRGRYSYHVLDVKPIRKILTEEGGWGANGVTVGRALHVCRGHFKDYRDGSGLFGRFKGLYWWEQSVRGDVANGVHVKDYRVAGPIGWQGTAGIPENIEVKH